MNQERIYTVLLAPHISEKSAVAVETRNQYVFKVARNASKPEIKKAVETVFNVKVTSVQTINSKGKTKRFGRSFGKRKDWKKAFVTLAEGSSIEMLTAE